MLAHPLARARAGCWQNLPALDWLMAGAADEERIGVAAAASVLENDRWTAYADQVLVAPLKERDDDREDVAPGLRQAIFVTGLARAVWALFKDPLRYEQLQSAAE